MMTHFTYLRLLPPAPNCSSGQSEQYVQSIMAAQWMQAISGLRWHVSIVSKGQLFNFILQKLRYAYMYLPPRPPPEKVAFTDRLTGFSLDMKDHNFLKVMTPASTLTPVCISSL